MIIRLEHAIFASHIKRVAKYAQYYVHPKSTARPLPKEVPDPYRQDFKEACLVLSDSPRASAALSRRCLESLLTDKAGVKHPTLAAVVQEVLDSNLLPSYLAEQIDGLRAYGIFAAHAIKDVHTGEIIDVEASEAEDVLNTLEGLFDFYFVLPAKVKARQKAADDKLRKAGKKPTKKPKP